MPRILERVGIPKNYITDNLIYTAQYLNQFYRPAWFHKKIALALMNSEIKRLIITMPPQHGKTLLSSVFYPLWELGNNPDLNIAVCAYGSRHAQRISSQALDFAQQDKFKRLFGHTIDPMQGNKDYWKFKSHSGGYLSVGVGGPLLGAAVDIAIIDDPYENFEAAFSEVQRENVFNWYSTVLQTRLQSVNSKIILIMTLWNEDDLVSQLQKLDLTTSEGHKWHVLKIPALSDYQGDDFFTGTPLWPEYGKTLEFYKEQRKILGPTMFDTQYMCNPTPMGDVLMPASAWDTTVSIPQIPSKQVRGWDLAYTGFSKSDFSSSALLARVAPDTFIREIHKWKLPWEQTKKKVKEIILNDEKSIYQVFETNGGQQIFVSDLQHDPDLSGYSIYGISSKDEKSVRALPWIIRARDKQIKLVRGEWNQNFIKECGGFRRQDKSGAHDDCVDAVSKAWSAMGAYAPSPWEKKNA
jgi:predicted phage terminase large subunit-like protein